MNRWFDLWLSRVRLWLPALLFLLLNLALFFGYRLILEVRVGVQTQALERAEEELASLRAERESTEAGLQLAERTGEQIQSIRNDLFATQAERLTRMMLEVKDLTRRARLRGPDNIRYTDETIEDFGLLKKEITFSVTGNYENVRQLINLIEISESFLVLEELGVDESDPGNLRINVTLSTLFEAGEGES